MTIIANNYHSFNRDTSIWFCAFSARPSRLTLVVKIYASLTARPTARADRVRCTTDMELRSSGAKSARRR